MKKKKYRYQYKKKINGTTVRIAVGGILLAVCIGLIVFLTVFRLKDVEIVGNTRNTEKEIEDVVMTGPFTWNTLLFSMSKKDVDTKTLHFVESIEVERISSHKIRIMVNEKQVVGYVRYLDCNVYFDNKGIVVESETAPPPEEKSPAALSGSSAEAADGQQAQDVIQPQLAEEPIAPVEVEEKPDENETQYHAAVTDIPYITGLKFDQVVMNQKLPVKDDTVFNTIQGIARIVDKYEILPDEVAFNKKNEITLHYGNILVELGKDTLLEEKITRVAAILPSLTGKTGTLHMEDYKRDTKNFIFAEHAPGMETSDSKESEAQNPKESEAQDADEEDRSTEKSEEDAEKSEEKDVEDSGENAKSSKKTKKRVD